MSVEEAVHAAIEAIEVFLQETQGSPRNLTAQKLRELSYRIEQARSIRAYTASSASSDLRPIRESYRASLERLRKRLSESELALRAESSSLAEENERLTSVRDWHTQFRATQ